MKDLEKRLREKIFRTRRLDVLSSATKNAFIKIALEAVEETKTNNRGV